MRNIKLVASISLVLIILAGPARSEFNNAEWEKVKEGKVTFAGVPMQNPDGSQYINFVTKIYVKASKQEIWKVIRDYDHFHEFMPKCRKVTTLKVEGNVTWVRYELKVLWINVVYHLRLVDTKSHERVEWTLDKSKKNSVRDIKGYWQLDDAPGGSGAVVSYASYVDTSIPAPMGIIKRLAKMALTQVMKNVRLRTESGGTWIKKKGS